MLEQKFIRQQPEKIREGLMKRGGTSISVLNEFLSLDEKWRQLLIQSDGLKKERNQTSEQIGKLKKAGENTEEKQEEVRKINLKIKEIETELTNLENTLNQRLLFFPNIPHETVPSGKDASENQIIRTWGEKRKFNFPIKPHWEIGESLEILDQKRASKLSGPLFSLYTGTGAKLQRALIQFMLDFHVAKHGYKEIYPPYLVKREIMVGTGQLPKFEEDMYSCEKDDLFLIPTAEVPVTNLHRDEILNFEELPKYYVSYTACFRREAGAAGSETRGLKRLHQFDKVELVKLTNPEDSYQEHEKLLNDAEEILQVLNIPYRVLLLCAGDMGFSAAKCYDIEAWSPAEEKWLEVSSVSNFEAFQARRANIRFRRAPQEKPEFVHTLNGSGLALPRVMIAILENYQEEDGSVVVPEILRPYMGGRLKL
jgi:seryl-tRNA synthetase